MANICKYEIRVKGSKLAALFVYAAMPCYDEKNIKDESGTEDAYELYFAGDCKWSVDSYCQDVWDKGNLDLCAINLLDNDGYVNEEAGSDYWYYTLQEKSRVLSCEIAVYSWSKESEFMEFAHYKDGIILKKETRKYAKSILFDWKSMSFASGKSKKAATAVQIKSESLSESELWETETLKNGTLRICAYRGSAEEVVVPDRIGETRVSIIGKKAFSPKNTKDKDTKKYLRTGMKRVILPIGIEAIEQSAFEDCRSLESISIQDGITKVGSYAFRDCSSLTEIILPVGVKKIGSNVFQNCSSLANVVISKGIKEINAFSFYNCSSLMSIVIPKGVSEIKNDAFHNCKSLSKIVLPEEVTKIGHSVFELCSGLTGIMIPKGITEIEYCAFSGCRSLTDILLPEGVIKIGSSAFCSCTALTSVTVPASVTNIEAGICYKTPFEKCPNLTLYVPAGSYAETFAKENNIPFVVL